MAGQKCVDYYYYYYYFQRAIDVVCSIVHSVRLLVSTLAYLMSDVYRSASDYLATISERALQLDVVG